MKDGIDVVNDIRALINIPEVTSQITGKVWADERWNDTSKTDVVVNNISTTNQWMQQAVLNVNIYAPGMVFTFGSSTHKYPPRKELKRLVNLIIPLLEEQYRNDFHCHIDRPAFLFEDADGSWYMNIRVKYYSIQDNFKNI